jgi:uncharacterized protein (TIGR01777 family)
MTLPMTSPMIPHALWPLITLQILMGAFDTLYHHEMTERLAWRPTQRHELQLHAVRNLIYAALFLVLGWREPHGLLAALVIAVLALEVIVTLMDFVEEDLSRKLPASERINHTLLALNYGAILTLLLPVLLAWAVRPTAFAPVSYGAWSAVATVAALGVAVFGLRDLAASRRAERLGLPKAADLVAALPALQTVLVTGATGFIGRRLVAALATAGHHPIVLTRDSSKAAQLAPPFRVVTRLDQIPAETRIDAIVNLAGEPIADRLWTAARRRRILASRLRVTRDVVHLIARLAHKPAVLVSASAVGWYGLWHDEPLTEFDGGKACFTHRVCEGWERAARAAERLGVRVVRLRIGLVLGTEGGLLARLLTPFEFGLGGPLGDGRQWMSWIARDDLVRLIAFCIATPSLAGAVNATAPVPVTNRTFAHELGHALRRPVLMRVPATVLRAVAGDLAGELMLGGQRVLPDKAEASGFKFRYPTLRPALSAMLGTHTALAGDRVARARRPRYFGGRDRGGGLSLRAGLADLAARHRLCDDRLLR